MMASRQMLPATGAPVRGAFAAALSAAAMFATDAAAQDGNETLSLVAGRESLLAWPRLTDPIKVYLPKDWTPERKWPLLLFYHGTGGRPSTSLPRDNTGDTGFVIAGMTYTVQGVVEADQTAQYYSDTFEISKEVRDRLALVASVDPARVYVGGFSKGGWTAAYFADEHPDFIAGAIIMGAGVNPYRVGDESLSRFRDGTPVYVGAGQLEMNYAVSLQARDHYGGRGAKVTLDIWDGLGHQPPSSPKSEYLQQWLQIEARRGELPTLKPAFESWLAAVEAKAAEAGKTDPVVEYLILERAGRAPMARFLSREQKARFSEHLGKLRSKKAVSTEWELRRRYEAAQKHESDGGFRLSNWESVIGEYFSIYEAAPESSFAKRAGLDSVRILDSIEEAARRRKREKGEDVGFFTSNAELVQKIRAIPASTLRDEFRALRETLTVESEK